MQTFSAAHLTATASALLLLAVPLAACSDSGPADASADQTSTSAAEPSTSPDGGLTPTDGAPPPPEPASPAAADEEEHRDDDETGTSTSDGTNDGAANAEAYLAGNGYYFLNPDGGAFCAIFGDGSSGNYSAGCQGEMPPPPELPDCVGGGTANAAVWLGVGGDAGLTCFNQGIFVGEPTSRGENFLMPGQSLSARGYTCTAADTAVTCRSDASGSAFTASGAGVSLLG